MKGHEKLDQKMLNFLVYHYFWGHLAILKDVKGQTILPQSLNRTRTIPLIFNARWIRKWIQNHERNKSNIFRSVRRPAENRMKMLDVLITTFKQHNSTSFNPNSRISINHLTIFNILFYSLFLTLHSSNFLLKANLNLCIAQLISLKPLFQMPSKVSQYFGKMFLT